MVYLMFFPENLRQQTAPYAVKTSLSGASSSCDREEFPASKNWKLPGIT